MKVCLNHNITFYFFDGEKFCNECGHSLTEGKFPCPKCKKVIEWAMNNNFCEWCGADLKEKDDVVDKATKDLEENPEHYKDTYNEVRMK